MKAQTLTLILLFTSILCKGQKPSTLYESKTLKIEKITASSYIHTSYLTFEEYGKIACNGMVIVNGQEAIVFDTPTTDSVSSELIQWFETNTGSKVTALVVTHFHVDCLGGINEFHRNSIPSYANNKTIELAQSANSAIPQIGFDNRLELNVGKERVVSEFLGEGHTVDNIVSYFPTDKVIFGGCLIKSVGAGKGNLNDANVNEWSNTVRKIKTKYGIAKTVIPGHGKAGDQDLLDFTIELFENE